MRSTLSPSFTSSKMRFLFVQMKQAADQFVDYLIKQNDDSIEIEMKDMFARYTTDVIATTVFGGRVNSLENRNNEFYLSGKEVTNFTGALKSLKLSIYTISPQLYKVNKIITNN